MHSSVSVIPKSLGTIKGRCYKMIVLLYQICSVTENFLLLLIGFEKEQVSVNAATTSIGLNSSFNKETIPDYIFFCYASLVTIVFREGVHFH